jgi:hypothetical protein
MTYDQWKTRSPDDERLGYLCGGHGRECGNTVSIPHDLCEECLEALAEEEALMDFYQWEPIATETERRVG